MIVNKKKEDEYVDKLYHGLRKRYKEGKSTSGGQRVLPTSGKGKVVLEKCRMKCAICPAKYQDQLAAFEIHHVDGNRANTVSSNLVLLCASCHRSVHSKANNRFDDYKKTHPQEIPPKNPSKGPKGTKPKSKPCVTVDDPFMGRIKVLKADTEVVTNVLTGQKFRAIKDEARIRGPRRC